MDRFIAAAGGTTNAHFKNLKSNMDRFIEMTVNDAYIIFIHLKSNMDRFIEAFKLRSCFDFAI